MPFVMELIIFLISVLLLLYFYMKNAHKYWQKKNIPFPKPNFFFGNVKDMMLLKSSAAQCIRKAYHDKCAINSPVVGFYSLLTPVLLIKDLNLLRRLLIKDFNNFSNRYSTVDPHADVLGYSNIFFIKNPEWKEIRTRITPVFSSAKLKQMLPLISEIGDELSSYLCGLKTDSKTNKIELEIKELSALYTTDVIATVAFGIQANSIKNPNGEFRENGRKIFSFPPLRAIKFNLMFFNPGWAKFFKFRFFSNENESFLRNATLSAIEAREKSGSQRNDLIDTLITLKTAETKNDLIFDDDLLVAQAAVFFDAGFETASSTMAFTSYELSKNPDCQSRLRDEIKETLQACNGQLSYDILMNMEYLNMVVMEVLRLYPPLPFLDRECTAAAGYSLAPDLDLTIPKGMGIYVPVYEIHRDPSYFPDPEKFDPERFSASNKNNITPYSYIPFGLGPHNCIGERLGLIQSKIGIISLLKNHYIKKTSRTPDQLKMVPAILLQSQGGIYLEIVKDPLI